MNLLPSSARPLSRLLLGAIALAALAACPKPEARKTFSLETLNKLYTGDGSYGVTEYRLDSQPFSPTLAYLFDQARLVALPEAAAPTPPAGLTEAPYAFTAVDRFGRLYHFDREGRWWMADGESLPETLPEGGWDVAWQPQGEALELLVTAPWGSEKTMQLLRWRNGRWLRVDLPAAPPVRTGAARLFSAVKNRWLVAGGKAGDDSAAAGGWTIEQGKWASWGGGLYAPPMGRTRLLLDGPEGSSPVLMTQTGALWVCKGERWKEAGTVKTEGLALARYIPERKQTLFVWGRGRGQDQFLWQTPQQLENGSTSMPELLPQTALVRVNDRDEGVWKGWGRAHGEKDKYGQSRDTLTPGFKGEGEPAVLIGTLTGDKTIRRSKIATLELPPALATVRCEAAAWVPALGGLVAPSACGLGIDARKEPFFPPEARESGATSPTQMIDVLEPAQRLWIFKEKGVDWLKPPFEIHPDIEYADSYETIDKRRRCLAWTSPEPGMLRYDFHEYHDKKVQWINSPRLTLKTIPQLAAQPGDQVYMCDPVVWGDPAELVVVGWCGKLGKTVKFDKALPGLGDRAYTQIPERGFMARISALNPQQWKVSTLPIPYCEGAQLVVAPERGSLYLLGGVAFEQAEHDGQKLHFTRSHNDVWQWDGESWRRITPQQGMQPRMKATSHVVWDPTTRQLLSLTPRALYGFEGEQWRCLWQKAKAHNDWPEDVALYVHPQSRLALGAWFMPRLTLRVWRGTGWAPVRLAHQNAAGVTTTTSTSNIPVKGAGGPMPNAPENLVPAAQPDAFISIDAARFNAMRMDAPRDRSQDRLMGAWRLTIRAADAGAIAYMRRALGSESPDGTPISLAPAAADELRTSASVGAAAAVVAEAKAAAAQAGTEAKGAEAQAAVKAQGAEKAQGAVTAPVAMNAVKEVANQSAPTSATQAQAVHAETQAKGTEAKAAEGLDTAKTSGTLKVLSAAPLKVVKKSQTEEMLRKMEAAGRE